MQQPLQPGWPPEDGEMARLIRSHDWGATPLGAPDSWAAGLRYGIEHMLDCAFPAYVWWGAQHIQLYNDAAIPMNRLTHPRTFAMPAPECWFSCWEVLGPLVERVLESGRPVVGTDLPLIAEGEGGSDPAWFTVSIAPLRDERRAPAGVLLTLNDTTRRIRAETRLRIGEMRAKKLFQQAPGLVVVLRGPDHIFEFTNQAAAKLLGGRDAPGRSMRDSALGVVGQTFLSLLDRAYETGERTEGSGVPIDMPDPSLGVADRRFLDLVVVPLNDSSGVVSGTFVMGFDVTDRVRAQRALRESEERQAFLLGLSDSLRTGAEAVEIQEMAARAIGTHLRVSRAFYSDVERDAEGAHFVVRRDYHAPGVTSVVGRYRASDFGTLVQEFLEGRSIAVVDIAEEQELSEVQRAAYMRVGARAWCAVPFMKNGVCVALLCVHQTQPREWEDKEMALLEETAERTWTTVQRARAEAALRLSEKQLRLQLLDAQATAPSKSG